MLGTRLQGEGLGTAWQGWVPTRIPVWGAPRPYVGSPSPLCLFWFHFTFLPYV